MYNAGHKTQQLVALAKDGDESALERLYHVYGERVRWMIRFRIGKVLRSKLESMDLVQDVFVHALQGLGDFTYSNEGDFVRWLSKITFRAVKNCSPRPKNGTGIARMTDCGVEVAVL